MRKCNQKINIRYMHALMFIRHGFFMDTKVNAISKDTGV